MYKIAKSRAQYIVTQLKQQCKMKTEHFINVAMQESIKNSYHVHPAITLQKKMTECPHCFQIDFSQLLFAWNLSHLKTFVYYANTEIHLGTSCVEIFLDDLQSPYLWDIFSLVSQQQMKVAFLQQKVSQCYNLDPLHQTLYFLYHCHRHSNPEVDQLVLPYFLYYEIMLF